MVKEDEEGNASVEEWCDADERKQKEYSSKEIRKNNVYKAILFSHVTK
jgi:hypothetical protein